MTHSGPILSAVVDPGNLDSVIANARHGDPRKRWNNQLARACDSSRPAALGKRTQGADGFDNDRPHLLRHLRIVALDVSDNTFEIVSRLRRLAHLHQDLSRLSMRRFTS